MPKIAAKDVRDSVPGTFFLGLGGQKCGSTWYREYLAGRAGSDFGRLGEYQVWEADLGGPFERYRTLRPSAAQRLKAQAKQRVGLPVPRDYLRWRMQTDREVYFSYFERILMKDAIFRTGDVTPSYAALPADTLHAIRDGFAARKIPVKVIFAMRDPVARLRSHLKMDQHKGYRDSTGHAARDLGAFYAGAEAVARSRYDETLDALEAVFSTDDTHICLMEEMVTPQGVAALSAFAGVESSPQVGATPVNARGSREDLLPKALEAEVAQHYSHVYRAVAQRLPQIRTVWPSARHVLPGG